MKYDDKIEILAELRQEAFMNIVQGVVEKGELAAETLAPCIG